MKVKAPKGIVMWKGKSRLGGGEVVVIATGTRRKSSNRKTGGMVQVYILFAGARPVDAIYGGADRAICGDCPHRAQYGPGGEYLAAGSCYVNVGQGPTSVYDAWKRGAYEEYDAGRHDAFLAGRMVRFGTYGDPAAAPVAVWRKLAKLASKRTGYTHQWRRAPWLRKLVMASVDTDGDAEEARRAGWRTFRVKAAASLAMPGEIVCPASEEAGKVRTCETCGACGGAKSGRAPSVVIDVHGLGWKVQRFAQTQERLTRRVALAMA